MYVVSKEFVHDFCMCLYALAAGQYLCLICFVVPMTLRHK